MQGQGPLQGQVLVLVPVPVLVLVQVPVLVQGQVQGLAQVLVQLHRPHHRCYML